jgi:hypothetical protein
MGSGGIAPPFLTLEVDEGEWSVSRPGHFTSGERAVLIGYEAGWVPESIWTLWNGKEKKLPGIEVWPSSP